MNCHYHDILSRIASPPLWWDENAVPRYEPFTPTACANIYADECVLLWIDCQACGRRFDVCLSSSHGRASSHLALLNQARTGQLVPSLAEDVRTHAIHYGDPPNVDCCPAGPTMNSIPRRVIEFWRQARALQRLDGTRGWERVADLEVDIRCDWADEEPLVLNLSPATVEKCGLSMPKDDKPA